jgi:hypothetical protein
VAGRDQRGARRAQRKVGVDVSLVAVSMDDIGARLGRKFSNARCYCQVDLPLAGDQMRLDAFFGSRFMQLQIWVCRVRKDAKYARVRALIQGAGHVQDDGLCAIHTSAADDVQNLHLQQLTLCLCLTLFD